jgi:antitoxin ParD1/3/4
MKTATSWEMDFGYCLVRCCGRRIDTPHQVQQTLPIMSAAITVQFPGELESFVQQRVGSSGLYDSASEYIRDLVRRDYEQEDRRRWAMLENELAPGMKADESEFVLLDAESILAEAKARKQVHGR